jgi:hypothetical protein
MENEREENGSANSLKVQECIDAAAYCERRAAAATDPNIKALFEATAQRWRQLAKQIERLERESDPG